MTVREALARIVAGGSMAEGEMESVLGELMRGEATPAQIGGFLIGLRMKGETVEEITGAARALRAHGLRAHPRTQTVVDTCGTGGDQKGTFNISTAAALIAGGAGVAVAKHGNRAMSGIVGGADVLEALGVRIDLAPERVAACVDAVGIGFFFAQTFHPAMRHAAGPRRELGVRTLFNLLGPLSNPAGARHQVLGVFDAYWTEPLAGALGRLGSVHALVVHGMDGLDEISLAAPTRISEWKEGRVHTFDLTPEEVGLRRCTSDDLRGGADREAAAAIIREILRGETGPRADTAILNAAAAIYVAGRTASIAAGIELARESVCSGAAQRCLEQLIAFTSQ
jgi:anthranilate phosphoribosyltransferase